MSVSQTVKLQLYYTLAYTLNLIVTELTATSAFFLLLIQLFCRAVPIGTHYPFGDPGLIHTPLHALHDKVKQSIYGFAYVIPISCTGFKIWYSAEGKKQKLKSQFIFTGEEQNQYINTAVYLKITLTLLLLHHDWETISGQWTEMQKKQINCLTLLVEQQDKH